MAEFEYIMRQASRMCNTQSMCSDKCPVYVHGGCCASVEGRNVHEIDYADAEARVLDWAKNNPEPVYPSWFRYQEDVFPEHTRWICPMAFGVACPAKSATSASICKQCRNEQIPAEIAEKLGIRPVDTTFPL